jgi:hypothetical protein
MATAPSHIKMQKGEITGPYTQSVAATVDGLLYMPNASSAGNLIVAAGNVLCGWPERRAAVGDKISLVLTGSGPAIASGAIALYAAVTVDSAGKCKTATVGTDQVHGWNDGPATTTDGDIFTLRKIS